MDQNRLSNNISYISISRYYIDIDVWGSEIFLPKAYKTHYRFINWVQPRGSWFSDNFGSLHFITLKKKKKKFKLGLAQRSAQ